MLRLSKGSELWDLFKEEGLQNISHATLLFLEKAADPFFYNCAVDRGEFHPKRDAPGKPHSFQS
jgi:hypothetical protein